MKNRQMWLAVLTILVIVAFAAPAAFAEGFMGLPLLETSRTYLPTGVGDYPVDMEIYDNDSNLWSAGIMHYVSIYDISDPDNPVMLTNGGVTVNAIGEDGIPITITAANAQAMADYGKTEYALVLVRHTDQEPVAMGIIQLYPEIQPQSTSFGPNGDIVTIPKDQITWTHYQIWSDEYNSPVAYGEEPNVTFTGLVTDTGNAYEADITAFTLSNGGYKLLLFESDPATAENFGAYLPFTFEELLPISDATVFLSTSGHSEDYSSSARADVTYGYVDLGIVIEDTIVTSGTYKIKYDSDMFTPSLWDWNLDLSAEPTVTTAQLQGNIVEMTVNFQGTINAMDTTETLFKLRFTASSEGTLPLYQSSMFDYNNGNAESGIQLFNGDIDMSILKKEYNDSRILFAFTDKAMVHYFHDLNSGEALTDGEPYYVFDDETVEPMAYFSDDEGGYFYDYYSGSKTVTAHMIDLGGYGKMGINSTQHYYETSEIQPDMLWADPHILPLTTEDITITINETGIGLSISNLEGRGYYQDDDWNNYTLDKTVTFAYVDDDTVTMTIVGGLSDYGDNRQYNFYIYDTGDQGGLLGRAMVMVDNEFANQDLLDLDMSGTVDLADLVLLAQSFGIDSSDQMYLDKYDLNSDGIINIFDLVILASEIEAIQQP